MKIRPKLVAPAIPYVAIIAGLHAMGNAWAAILFYHGGMAAIVALDNAAGLGRAIRSGWNGPAAVAGAVACAGAGILIFVLWPYVRIEAVTLHGTLSRIGLGGVSWWVFGLYFFTLHPLLEELGWRCYLAPAKKGPHWIDLAFAGYHVLVLVIFVKTLWVAVAFVVLALASWGWRIVVRWKAGLGVALVSHAAADLSIFLAATIIAAQ